MGSPFCCFTLLDELGRYRGISSIIVDFNFFDGDEELSKETGYTYFPLPALVYYYGSPV